MHWNVSISSDLIELNLLFFKTEWHTSRLISSVVKLNLQHESQSGSKYGRGLSIFINTNLTHIRGWNFIQHLIKKSKSVFRFPCGHVCWYDSDITGILEILEVSSTHEHRELVPLLCDPRSDPQLRSVQHLPKIRISLDREIVMNQHQSHAPHTI